MYINKIYQFFTSIYLFLLYFNVTLSYNNSSDLQKRNTSDASLRSNTQASTSQPLVNSEPDTLHEFRLEKLRELLDVRKSAFIRNNVNLLEKYDIVKMTANYPLTTVGFRSTRRVCSKFNWQNASPDWIMRLSTYNYHLCTLDQGGGGDCFFYSLAGSLRMSGFTKEKIKQHNLNNPLFKRFVPQNNDETYFNQVELRKIAAAYFSTFNPEVPGDEKNFNEALFRDRMSFFDRESLQMTESAEERIKANLNEKMKTTPAIDIAREVYNLNAQPMGEHWGDWVDKSSLEKILGLTIILFRNSDTCINMGEFQKSDTPKIYVMLYYINLFHYQSAGLVHLNNPSKVYSAFDSGSIPDALSLMAYLDSDAEL